LLFRSFGYKIARTILIHRIFNALPSVTALHYRTLAPHSQPDVQSGFENAFFSKRKRITPERCEHPSRELPFLASLKQLLHKGKL
jgi:hypothetical protein